MKKLKRMWRSFHKNIIVKKKFRSYFMSIVDKEYRQQINRIYELTKDSKTTVMEEIPSWRIEPGHKIIYPEYELWLYCNCNNLKIDPIKVVSDGKGKFIVVDGNHRLTALKQRAFENKTCKILCEVII